MGQRHITIFPDKEMVGIKWTLSAFHKKEKDGTLACYLPELKIYYQAQTRENALQKADTITKMVFDHFVLHNKKGLASLVLHLHKLGFKADNDAITIKNFLNNSIKTSKFKSFNDTLPDEFIDAEEVIVESEMAIAS